MWFHDRARAASLIAATLVLGFVGCFVAWPLIALAMRVLDMDDASVGGLAAADVGEAAITTIVLAALGTVASLLLGLPATMTVARGPRRLRGVLGAVLSAPFALPTVVVALAIASIERDYLPWLGAGSGVVAIVLALAVFNIAVVVRAVAPAIGGVDDRLLAAARSLGATPTRVATTVLWPAARRAIAGAALVTFMFCSASFALVLILGGTRIATVETLAYSEVTTFLNLRGAALLAVVQAAIVVTVGLAARRWGSTVIGAAPAQAHGAAAASRRERLTLAALALPALAVVSLPFFALAINAGRAGAEMWPLFTETGIAGPGSPSLAESSISSLALAARATLMAALLAVCVVVASRSRGLRMVGTAAMVPLAVSSVVLGLGLLVAWAPTAQRVGAGAWLLAAAQATVALPLMVKVVEPAVATIDPRLLAAARTLGASPLRLAVTVVCPLARPAAFSALGLGFAVALGEFGASAFLVRSSTPTLPTTIVRLLSHPGAQGFQAASLGALVLAVLTAGIMMATAMAGRRRLG